MNSFLNTMTKSCINFLAIKEINIFKESFLLITALLLTFFIINCDHDGSVFTNRTIVVNLVAPQSKGSIDVDEYNGEGELV